MAVQRRTANDIIEGLVLDIVDGRRHDGGERSR